MTRYLPILILLCASRVFSASISSYIEAAEQVDPTYHAAIRNKNAGNENIAIARARLLPQLSAQSTRYKTDQDIIRSSQASTYEGKSLNSQLNFRQPIFRPRDWYGLSVGELQSELAFQQFGYARTNLWNRTIYSWLDYVQVTINHHILKEQQLSSQKSVLEIESRFKAGESTKDVVLATTAQDKLFQAEIQELFINIEVKKNSFFLITNKNILSKDLNMNFDKLRFNQLTSIKNELDALYISENPEILAAEINTKIASKKISQAKSDHYPSIDLVANYIKSDSDTVATLGTSTTSRQVGITVLIPIFNGGGSLAVERQVVELYEAAKHEQDAIKNRIINQYMVDSSQLEINHQKILANKSALTAALVKQSAMEIGYKNGVRSYAEFAIAARDYVRTKNSYNTAAIEYLKTLTKLASNINVNHPIWEKLLLEFELLR